MSLVNPNDPAAAPSESLKRLGRQAVLGATIPPRSPTQDENNAAVLGQAGGPPAPSDPSKRPAPIGVPPSYALPEGGGFVRYFIGDDWQPANRPEIIPQIKRDLVEAGLLDLPYDPNPTWDDKTRAAYRGLLALSNAAGITKEEQLAELKASTAKYGRAAASRVPLVLHKTNPADVATVANTVSARLLGRRLLDSELSTFTSAFQQMEMQAAQQQYDLTGSADTPGPGGAMTDPPNLGSFVEQQLRANNPGEISENNYRHSFEDFQNLLDSSSARYRSFGSNG